VIVLSRAERKFLSAVKKGDLSEYTPVYKRQLKHNILKKRKALTDDLLLVNEVLDELEAL
jgi:hypothetical protein